jgi:hypothetical protein
MRGHEPHDEVVAADEDCGAEQPAGQREVVADDRVLDDVRQQEQDDEVERVQLCELPLPREVQQDEQAEVDGDGPDRLLPGRDAEVEQVVDDGSVSRGDRTGSRRGQA